MSKGIILLPLFLASCATMDKSEIYDYSINEIIIRNSSNDYLKSVQLKVEKNHGIFGCSYIISHAECSTTFPVRAYAGNWINITWQIDGVEVSTGNIRIPVGDDIKRGSVVRGVVEIRNSREISAYIENQLSP